MNDSLNSEVYCILDCTGKSGPMITCSTCGKTLHQECAKYTPTNVERVSTWKCCLCEITTCHNSGILPAAYSMVNNFSDEKSPYKALSL